MVTRKHQKSAASRVKAIRFCKNGLRINFVNDFNGLLVQCANALMRLYEVYITSALNGPVLVLVPPWGWATPPHPLKGVPQLTSNPHTGLREMEH